MAATDKDCQIRIKNVNNDLLTLYPKTIIKNVDGLQSALDGKVNVISGKGLSTNDYTTKEKTKLASMQNLVNNGTSPVSSQTVNMSDFPKGFYLITMLRAESADSRYGISMYAMYLDASTPLFTTIVENINCKATFSLSGTTLTINYAVNGYYLTSLTQI